MKYLKIITIVIAAVILLVALAGVYKFNYLQDDIFIETGSGEVIQLNEYESVMDDSIVQELKDFEELQPEVPTLCTMEYAPVCGQIDTGIRCITVPCPSFETKTFSNGCMAAIAKATVLYKGECELTTEEVYN